jgi:inhibitor of KinA sporulation pathway (predicted exonuclease)
MMFSKNESPRGSLKEAMSRYNSVFDGQEHRADIDAQNTLKFWFDLMRKQNDFMTDKSYNNNKGLANG